MDLVFDPANLSNRPVLVDHDMYRVVSLGCRDEPVFGGEGLTDSDLHVTVLLGYTGIGRIRFAMFMADVQRRSSTSGAFTSQISKT